MSFKLPTPGPVLWMGTYPGHLYPLSRPRFSKGHVYQPLTNQKDFRKWLRTQKPIEPWTDPVWVECFFCFKTKKESDNDNLLKAVFDGLQSQEFIKNDKKILGGTHARMHGAAFPSTTIVIREVIFHVAEDIPEAGR